MSESRFRSNIYQITFFFSLLVVWVHSANWELFAGQSGLGNEAFEAVAAAEKILGEGLAQMAVPGFFLVSAYLFFQVEKPALQRGHSLCNLESALLRGICAGKQAPRTGKPAKPRPHTL